MAAARKVSPAASITLWPASPVLLGELGDRRGLAAAVDADDENDERPLGEIETQRLHHRLDEPDHLFG